MDIRLHNLLTAPPTQGFDLILCRNVVIYFTDDAKAVLYDHLVNSLRPGGILFVGGTEMVASAHQLGLSSIGPSFYRKAEVASTAPRPFARPSWRLARWRLRAWRSAPAEAIWVARRNLIDYLEGDYSLDEFLDDFPSVSREQAVAALEVQAVD